MRIVQLPIPKPAASLPGSGGRSLVGASNALLARFDAPSFSTEDLVHGDFRLGNVLFDGERVSGVVGIEALGSGSRALDYATLLDHPEADEDAVQLLVAAGVQAAGPVALAHSLVHVLLDLVMFMSGRILTIDSAPPTNGPKRSPPVLHSSTAAPASRHSRSASQYSTVLRERRSITPMFCGRSP